MDNWIKRSRCDEMVGFFTFLAFAVGLLCGLAMMGLAWGLS